MTVPSDRQRLVLTVLFAAWVIAVIYAFVAYANASFEGRSLPGVTHKLTVFLGWHGMAGMFAVAIFGVARNWPRRSAVRRLSLVPLGVAVGIVAAIAGVDKLLV